MYTVANITIVLSLICISVLIIIFITLNAKLKKINLTPKGCLAGKTEKQKQQYFESLYSFFDEEKDLLFHSEQFKDLTESEAIEYGKWVVKHKQNK